MAFKVEETDTTTWKRVLDEYGVCIAYLEQTEDGRWQLSDNITFELLCKQIFNTEDLAIEWLEATYNV